MNPEDEVLGILKKAGVDTVLTLPCDRVKVLLSMLPGRFNVVPLTREEEGVGIAAGLALAGGRPAMVFQSSGLGNMLNALASLTMFYKLPLLMLISWRGVYKEGIEAQKPMGRLVPRLLDAMDIDFVEVNKPSDISTISAFADDVFEKNSVGAVLLNPLVWEGSTAKGLESGSASVQPGGAVAAKHTRHELIEGISDALKGKIVVSNLGVPSKELYSVLDQGSNFYMLGSMGMATPIGIGLSLATDRDVVVLDGDGSVLMNPGSLATAAQASSMNLSIVALDNGSHGSTGGQPTATRGGVDLGLLACSMGFRRVYRASKPDEVLQILSKKTDGPRFIHAVAKPGNADVPNIPLSASEIKERFMKALKEKKA